MKHLWMAIHYPRAEHVDDLLNAMAGFGKVLALTPGLVDVQLWRDAERIIAMSVWESRGALDAALPRLAGAVADVPFDAWEARPRELLNVDEVPVPGRE